LENRWRWIIEWLTPESAHLWYIKKILYSGKTKYQEIDIVETEMGVHLLIDGKTQSTEFDEFIYHESLVHPALLTHEKPSEVLVIGGGEGATIREVLKHNVVEKVTMIDIDDIMIELSKKYLLKWHKGSFNNPRVKLVIADGREFIEKSPSASYDIVILDVTDPTPGSPSNKLYTYEFYKSVYKVLKEDGLMVTQATSTSFSAEVFATIYYTISKVFPITRGYHVFVPSFLSMWGFVIGSKKYDPLTLSEDELKKRILARNLRNLSFYHEGIHRALFAMGKNLLELIEKTKRLSTDQTPVYMPI